MTSVVLSCATLRSSAWMARSLAESSAEVASSKIRIGGFFSSVRAIATRCFSPPDELEAALADHGVVALGRGGDEVVDVRRARRRLDLGAARAGAAVGDVVFDRVVEQHRVLRHDADRLRAGWPA